MGIIYLKQIGPIASDSVLEQEIFSPEREITLMLSLMVPSRKECPSSSTTERLALSSMSPSTPSVLSSTSVLVAASSPRDSMSVLSTSACPDPELPSSTVSTRTIESSVSTRVVANSSLSRESPPNPERATSSTPVPPPPSSLTPSSSENSTERRNAYYPFVR